MNFVIVSAVYPPEPVVSARTSADLAAALTGRGHAVTVLAPLPSRPAGRRYPGYSARLFQRETQAGIEIIRCRAAVSSESSLTSRLWENLSFGLLAASRLLGLRPRPQAIYANTWPLLAQGLLALAARLRRIPLVLSIQDLYPESLASQGRLAESGRWLRLLAALDGRIARSARALVLISPRFVQVYRVQRRVPADRLHVIPNWLAADDLLASLAALDGQPNPLRARLGLAQDAFLLVYAGNIGAGAGVESLLHALALLPEQPDLHLLVAGEGARLADCRRLAAELRLERLHFLSSWPEADTAAVLSAADLLLLPTRRDQALASLPSKLAYYLLSGRPVLAAAAPGSDLAEIIAESGCGWLVPPDDPAALAQAIHTALQTPPAERQSRGASGRTYALAHFTKQANLPRLVELVESLGAGTSQRVNSQ